MGAALVIGFIVGLAVVLLVILVEAAGDASSWVHKNVANHDVAFFLTVPAGLLVAWFIAQRFSKNVESGGVTETISAVGLRAGYLSTRTILPKIASTAATLGVGGSGGREGPIVMIGAAIGSSLSRYTRFSEDRVRSLVAAGAGAGIGATFNAPIAGMLFAMEVILGNLAIRHLNAVVVASVVAAVTTHTLLGEEQILSSPGGSFEDPRELLLYLALGLLAVGAALLFVQILTWVNEIKHRYRYPDWTRPLAAGAVIAAIALVDDRALGTGQEYLSGLMRIEKTYGTDLVLWTLPLLVLFKMITNALTRSGGGSAGTFMPSLFIGGTLGTALVLAVEPFWFGDLEPASYAMVGMAATFAAVARAPLTAIIMVFEITGNYALVLPLMLAASTASFLADRIHPDSVYTMPLTKAGVHLVQNEDVDLLDTVTVKEVMTVLDDTLHPSMTISEAARFLDESRHHGMPVVEEDGSLAGVLTLIDVALAEGNPDETLVQRCNDRSTDHSHSNDAGVLGLGQDGRPRSRPSSRRRRRKPTPGSWYVPPQQRCGRVPPRTGCRHRPAPVPTASSPTSTARRHVLRSSDSAGFRSCRQERQRPRLAGRSGACLDSPRCCGDNPTRRYGAPRQRHDHCIRAWRLPHSGRTPAGEKALARRNQMTAGVIKSFGTSG